MLAEAETAGAPGPRACARRPLATAAVVLVDSAIDAIVVRNTFPEGRIPEGLVP